MNELVTKSDDSRVANILDEYVAALYAGNAPSREELLARYPDLAEELAVCLESLQFIRCAALPPTLAAASGDMPAAEPGAGTLGDFRLIRPIGHGGMGIVYEAEQLSLARRVALKILPFAAAMDPKQLQRFKNEAQAAGHLHHTNIVPVYFVGCERGVHFYAMQFIEGQSLAQVIADLRLQIADLKKEPKPKGATSSAAPICNLKSAICNSTQLALVTEASTENPQYFRTVAHLGVQAAEALEHAHEMGVIHRDIKPGNLLLDARGNVWITDFGLAQVSSDAKLTLTGDLVGTLRYMSPEQALAKRVVIDHRTDIYSLGMTLYELLTLEPAFAGKDREEVLRQIAFEEPKAPGLWDRSVPADLQTIVMKCLEKNPHERYLTAQDMAEDLRRWLEDKAIKARRPGSCSGCGNGGDATGQPSMWRPPVCS